MKYLIMKSPVNPNDTLGTTITITAEEAAKKITAFAENGYIDYLVVDDYKTIQAIWTGLTSLRTLYAESPFRTNDKTQADAIIKTFQAEANNYLRLFKVLVENIKNTGNQGARLLEEAYDLIKTLFEGEIGKLKASVAATFSDG